MTDERDPALLRLAEDVSDEMVVDWKEHDETSGPVARLREIEQVIRAFRDSDDGPNEVLFRWGELEVLDKVGEGAFGEVYRARDPVLDRFVALKLRRLSGSETEDAGRRIVTEGRRLARVRHPNVLAVHGAAIHDGCAGVWTELVEGTTLAEPISEGRRLGAHEATSIAVELCRALAAVHAQGLVHGDVKATNVLRDTDGRIVLGDFGSTVESDREAATSFSPATAAPEVLQGHPPTTASDFYSLGALIYQLVTGGLPVEGTSYSDLLEGHRANARRPLRDLRPDLPSELVAIVEKLLDADPKRRFRSAGELERALTGASLLRSKWRRHLVWLAVGLGAAAMAATGLMVGQEWLRSDRPPAEVSASTPAPEPEGRESHRPHEPVSGPAGTARPLAATATLMRRTGEASEALLSGARVAPGDRLYLELESAEQVHAYVFNEDDRGGLFRLFPLPGLDVGNPLPRGSNVLPGLLDGVRQDWRVTSAGGIETFLVVVARHRLEGLENELARFEAASADRPVHTAEEPAPLDILRGVGGLVSDARTGGGAGQLAEVHEALRERQRRDGSIWVRLFEVSNPAPPRP